MNMMKYNEYFSLSKKISSREHLLPTKATILALKARKISYVKGHDLLKKKADSL